jgi:hypothetical protein
MQNHGLALIICVDALQSNHSVDLSINFTMWYLIIKLHSFTQVVTETRQSDLTRRFAWSKLFQMGPRFHIIIGQSSLNKNPNQMTPD